MQHYFLPHDWQQTTEFQLDAATYKHFVQVLRATEGTEAEFVTPLHELLIAQLVKLDSDHRSATMHVERKQTVDVELPVHARIICGVPKGDKAELITQKQPNWAFTKLFLYLHNGQSLHGNKRLLKSCHDYR